MTVRSQIMYSQSEYERLQLTYGINVAERYKNLVSSPNYRNDSNLEVRGWEEGRGRPRLHTPRQYEEGRGRPRLHTSRQCTEELLPSCLNVAGVRLTPAKIKKILGAVAIFPSVQTSNYQFRLIPRTLFATAKELGWRYNAELERWEFLNCNIKRSTNLS